ncbi:thermonuclease family protein [Agrobacterium salinitolerans]|uniref:thermonuclease family protein n=1 Tax=Agrobacterium salinitolerans TaxID=1183413 RepID=UPI0022B83975|nr:thermonuclease family protein [Agrobacterium salinitolerans]MCZ7857077.1 thermonuclease family protein [Agrobacterium salinitolerans]
MRSIYHLILVFTTLCAIIAVSSIATAAELMGRASLVDGDTIEIGGQRIRLHGVDAPESAQICIRANGARYRCGKESALALDSFLAASRPTRCVEMDRDRYKRVVAECFRADGANVNAWMVRNGHAVDWVRYSKGRYSKEQAEAQREALGVWSGSFEMPCAYRAMKLNRKPSC